VEGENTGFSIPGIMKRKGILTKPKTKLFTAEDGWWPVPGNGNEKGGKRISTGDGNFLQSQRMVTRMSRELGIEHKKDPTGDVLSRSEREGGVLDSKGEQRYPGQASTGAQKNTKTGSVV